MSAVRTSSKNNNQERNMQSVKRILGALALLGAVSATASAQIGSGWTSTSVSYSTQVSSGCSVSGSTFTIDSGSGRAERRYATLTSGSRQFQGTFKVSSLGGNRVAVWQTFSEANGPWQMGAVDKSASKIYEVEGGSTLNSFSVGSSYRINTIATSGGSVQVYVNGSQKESKTGGSSPYNKIGSYATSSGAGPCTTTWSSIAFWKK
jgi:hypothetical protein